MTNDRLLLTCYLDVCRINQVVAFVFLIDLHVQSVSMVISGSSGCVCGGPCGVAPVWPLKVAPVVQD